MFIFPQDGVLQLIKPEVCLKNLKALFVKTIRHKHIYSYCSEKQTLAVLDRVYLWNM